MWAQPTKAMVMVFSEAHAAGSAPAAIVAAVAVWMNWRRVKFEFMRIDKLRAHSAWAAARNQCSQNLCQRPAGSYLQCVESNSIHWDDLQKLAEEEVREILRSLPPELRERAVKLPLCFELVPNEKWVEDGIEPDTLGLFVGEAFPDGVFGGVNLPAQIILFLENLWEMAEGEEETFRLEVRRTYLHELGHYLGLDEFGLEERGLE
jgi:predicted Zn-dependent protease with MMP-like domain